jgi:hypothetical protein
MIQPLRVAHRRAFVGLAVVLPAILLIGLGARTSRPGDGVLIPDVPAPANVVRASSNLWQNHTIHSTFYSRSDRLQEVDVVLQSAQDLNSPDVLLYWADNAPQGNALPGDAKLVGSFRNGKAFLIPLNEERTGYLVLFSSAHKSVFDTARVEKLP